MKKKKKNFVINKKYMENVSEIKSIIFGVLSEKDILNMSVCKIDNTKLSGQGSIYDERMGCNTETNIECITCNLSPKECPGHFGHIELNEYIIHPLFYKYVLSFLKCFCMHCNKLLITKDQIIICGLHKYKEERRYKKILDKIEKINMCSQCTNIQPKIIYNITDNTYSIVYVDVLNQKKKDNNKQSIILNVIDIKKIFDAISDDDIVLCGFNPSRIHPKNLILSIFPVIPPCARPYVIADGHICDDDLTNQLIEIIKINNLLKINKDIVDEKSEQKRIKNIQALKFRISTFYNNSHCKAKHPTNGRPIKGLKERISGKEGQIRNNLMGKRVNYSSRTVIGPDPNLEFGWMGIPIEITKELTKPEKVCEFNIKYLESLVNTNKANFILKASGTKINLKYATNVKGTQLLHSDIIIRNNTCLSITNTTIQKGDIIKRDGLLMTELYKGDILVRDNNRIVITDPSIPIYPDDIIHRENQILSSSHILTLPSKKYINLEIGDEVHRHLKNGDIVLLNRQPTLHKGSMLAMRIKIIPGKTFRMNLATCKTFNADFDGDEMNIHVPQCIEAEAELIELSAAQFNIISPQGSKPNIAIVQDSLTGAFLMTKENKSITKSQFLDISLFMMSDNKMLFSDTKIQTILNVLTLKGKIPEIYNGRGLISLVLPENFIYEKRNDAYLNEPTVKIYNGVFYEGALDKNTLGQSTNSLIQIINKEYGYKIASDFITNIQYVTNKWLLINGFSIGLEDCLIKNQSSIHKIQDKLKMCYMEAGGLEEITINNDIKEIRVIAALNKAKDVGQKIAKDDMNGNNNFLSTVYSGSKGDFFNIAQLTGLLGQQNILAKRVHPMLNHGTRTLVHYPFTHISKELEYESRGFIKHSFIDGLNPCEFFFHAMSGREGICDTAMGTAKSGYIQRRIIKVCEDIQIKYDGTVRDTFGKIYQMSYGYNNFDPSCTIKVNDYQQPYDISRIVDKLNLDYELNLSSVKKPIEQPIEQLTLSIEQLTLSSKKIQVMDGINLKEIQSIILNFKSTKRIDILKLYAKITGTKNLYLNYTNDELIHNLQELL